MSCGRDVDLWGPPCGLDVENHIGVTTRCCGHATCSTDDLASRVRQEFLADLPTTHRRRSDACDRARRRGRPACRRSPQPRSRPRRGAVGHNLTRGTGAPDGRQAQSGTRDGRRSTGRTHARGRGRHHRLRHRLGISRLGSHRLRHSRPGRPVRGMGLHGACGPRRDRVPVRRPDADRAGVGSRARAEPVLNPGEEDRPLRGEPTGGDAAHAPPPALPRSASRGRSGWLELWASQMLTRRPRLAREAADRP